MRNVKMDMDEQLYIASVLLLYSVQPEYVVLIKKIYKLIV